MRIIGIVLLAVLALTGCGGDEPAPAPTVAPIAPPPAETPVVEQVDPYEAYLQLDVLKPADWAGDWPLTREDAQTRALLGCDTEWAPGTIDAALAEAYAELCP